MSDCWKHQMLPTSIWKTQAGTNSEFISRRKEDMKKIKLLFVRDYAPVESNKK